MTLSAEQRRYLVREQMIAPAIFNFALNAAIAWLLFRSLSTVPLWGASSLAVDTLVTLFLLPFLTCLIVTPQVRRARRRGVVAPLAQPRAAYPALRWLPESLTGRAAALGALGVLAGAPLLIGGLVVAGVESLSPGYTVLLKGVYTALLSCAVNPLVALCALSDVRPREPARDAT